MIAVHNTPCDWALTGKRLFAAISPISILLWILQAPSRAPQTGGSAGFDICLIMSMALSSYPVLPNPIMFQLRPWYSRDIILNIFIPSSTKPAWLQAERIERNVTLFGITIAILTI